MMHSAAALARLRDAGFRLTEPRRAVVAALERVGPHITADEVLRHGREIHAALGRATVYRTLELCTELGLLRPVVLGDGGLHYIVAEGGHHHLICTTCGKSVEFDDCALGGLEEELARRFRFEIRGHLLELYGLCSDCRA